MEALISLGLQWILLFAILSVVFCIDKYPKEFIFELPDNDEMCFYETFTKDMTSDKFILSFRVIKGGNNDVDFTVTSPNSQVVYQKEKTHFDETELSFSLGTYSMCFSNKFSTITHKQIYFQLNRKRVETLDEEVGAAAPTALTLLQTKMEAIHEYLATVETVQTQYKVREAEGRSLSEDLNQRVMLMSTILTLAIVICGFGQVAMLKTFFSDKPSVSYPKYPSVRP